MEKRLKELCELLWIIISKQRHQRSLLSWAVKTFSHPSHIFSWKAQVITVCLLICSIAEIMLMRRYILTRLLTLYDSVGNKWKKIIGQENQLLKSGTTIHGTLRYDDDTETTKSSKQVTRSMKSSIATSIRCYGPIVTRIHNLMLFTIKWKSQ